MPPASASAGKGAGGNAGRGVVVIAGAKAFFIVTSYAVQLVLPRLMDREAFGLFAAAMGALAMLTNVLISSTIQTVSRFVAERSERSGLESGEGSHAPVLARALRVQATLGVALAGGLAFGAGGLARFLEDDALTPLFRMSAGVVLAYALYAAFVGLLNGRREFVRQAKLDLTFSTLRTSGILGGAFLGGGALGAIGGFATAATTILVLGALVALRELARSGETKVFGAPPAPSLRAWLAFFVPIALYQLFLNGLLLVDLQVLKKSLAELALEQGLGAAEAAAASSTLVGYYRGAQTFAFVPYQLIIALTFVIFPLITRATATGDAEAARATITRAFRFALLLLLSIAAPVAGAADGVLRIAYPADFVVAAPALRLLVFGICFFALSVVSATVLGSAGRPTLAAQLGGLALVALLGATRLAALGEIFTGLPVPALAPGLLEDAGLTPELLGDHAALQRVALATSLSMALAFALAGTAVYRRFRALLPLGSLARALFAALVAATVAYFVPHGTRFLALVSLAAGFFSYLAVLVLSRELGPSDLRVVRAALGR